MANIKQLVAVLTKDIVLIKDPSHPLYDPRVERPRDEFTRAGYRADGQRTPVELMTRENAERIGASFEGGPYTVISGRGRRGYCEDVEIDFMTAFVVEVKDLAHFWTLALRENGHRDEETFGEQLKKARAIYDAGGTLESISCSIKKPLSTVKDLLKISDPAQTIDAIREMADAGELDHGSAKQIATLPKDVQPEAVTELAKVQADALTEAAQNGKLAEAAAEPGKEVRVKTASGDTATLTVKPDGTPVVKPSQDTTQKAKAKVQNKAAPASTKTEAERKAPVALDAAMIGSHKARIALLRKMPGHNFAEIVAGAEMLAARLTGQDYTLPENASEVVKAAHAFIFAKAE